MSHAKLPRHPDTGAGEPPDAGENDMDHSELLKRITARPDVPARQRIALIADVVQRHRRALEARAVVTIRGGRIRIAHPPVQ